mgnify:CR=1 FL=1
MKRIFARTVLNLGVTVLWLFVMPFMLAWDLAELALQTLEEWSADRPT